MWVVGSKIVIGLYILDMWSVLCVPYVGGGVDRTVHTGHVVMWSYVLSKIVIGLCTGQWSGGF